MTFIDWDQYARLGVFGGIFLVALFAVLWLWYDTSGRQVAGLWAWRIIPTLLIGLTVPALVLGAANLDADRETLLNVFAWMAIGGGAAAVVAVIAYATWGRIGTLPTFDAEERFTEPLPAPPDPTPIEFASPPPPAKPRRANGHFIVRSGPERGKQYALYDTMRVGRSAAEVGGDGIVINDRRVSGAHAQVKFSAGEFVFTDLNSTNGSFLLVEGREQRLRSSQTLVDGDEIRIGHTVLQFIDSRDGNHR